MIYALNLNSFVPDQIEPRLSKLAMSLFAKLFFGTVRESVVYVEIEILYTTIAAKVERFSFLHTSPDPSH
jgi:hypothetical protein